MADRLRPIAVALAVYELHPDGAIGQRSQPASGALARITFSNLSVGYADVHVWESLGDPALNVVLADLASGAPTLALARRALAVAAKDATARASRTSLVSGVGRIRSHALLYGPSTGWRSLLERARRSGQTVVKLKLPRDVDEAIGLVRNLADQAGTLRIRLDPGGLLGADGLAALWSRLGSTTERVDFIEDPFAFDPLLWAQVQGATGARLALDRDADRLPSQVDRVRSSGLRLAAVVIKPARADPEPVAKAAAEVDAQQLVVTSYLAHPYEIGCAAAVAAQLAERYRIGECGFDSFRAYQRDDFSDRWGVVDGKLRLKSSRDETGYGFDDLLTEMEFKTWTH